MSISSDEVNFLIYRYLLENGFAHSAFSFSHESLVNKSTVSQCDVPPGALITFLQKGLEYVGIEEHIAEDGTVKDFDANYSLLSPFIVQAVGTKEERKIEKTKNQLAAENKAKEQMSNGTGGKMEISSNATPSLAGDGNCFAVTKHDPHVHSVTLQGHQGEVFICLWNPHKQQLASGSADGTCRVWGLTDAGKSRELGDGVEVPVVATVMPHAQFIGERFKDVTSLHWSPDGTRLATGCYDGVARVWSEYGVVLHELQEHTGPVFSIKWSKDGKYLLSGSYDRRSVVWDADTGIVSHIFTVHAAPVLDVDWRDSSLFATSSSDRKIHVCEIVSDSKATIDPTKALCTFEGHTDEVNCIVWSPGGHYLASCSDDTTAKIWTIEDRLKFNLKGHTKEIYTVRWTPTGPGSLQPDQALRLCSASFDGTVKVWSVEDGSIVFNLSRHGQPVYSLASNPSGSTLATGSLGGYVTLWSLEDGSMENEVRGMGDTFDVSWSNDGSMLSSCFSSGAINIMLVK